MKHTTLRMTPRMGSWLYNVYDCKDLACIYLLTFQEKVVLLDTGWDTVSSLWFLERPVMYILSKHLKSCTLVSEAAEITAWLGMRQTIIKVRGFAP